MQWLEEVVKSQVNSEIENCVLIPSNVALKLGTEISSWLFSHPVSFLFWLQCFPWLLPSLFSSWFFWLQHFLVWSPLSPRFSSFFWLQHWTLNIRLARPHFPSLPLSLFSSYFWLQHFLVWFGVAGAPFSLFFYLFTFFIPSLVSFFSSLFFSLSFSSLFFSLPFSSLFFSLSFSSFHFLLFCFFWLLNFFWLGAALPKYTEFPGLSLYHHLSENVWFVWSKTSYSGDKRRCYQAGRTTNDNNGR